MKKDILKIALLSIILVIISVIVIYCYGNTYTVRFLYKDNAGEFIIENEPGDVEIISQEVIDNYFYLKVKGKSPGKVYISLEHSEYSELAVLYVHRFNIITDNSYFGKSTGSSIIPISICIILVYILYLLIKRYTNYKKDNLYQYKNIAYLGIIIFLSLFTIYNFLSLFNYNGLNATVNNFIGSVGFVSMTLFPMFLITFILVTISNINLIRKEGKSLSNLLGLFFGLFLIILSILPDKIYEFLMVKQWVNIYNLNSPGPYIYLFFESLIHLVVAYLECIFIATIITALRSVKKKIEYNKDYVIILGCQIRKDGSLTPLLRGRVDRAIKFREEQLKNGGKDIIFITSGGKGDNEIISEGEAMKRYLLEKGISSDNILVEGKSKNTYENIKFSNKLVKKNSNVIFSTTNYHVLRAGLIATSQGLRLEGIGSKTKSYFWINAFIREFIGTLYSERKKHVLLFILLMIVLGFMIYITYLGNTL